MKKLYFTIENSGCGLGDMLHRIDTIYKFCTKNNHTFVMPDIASNLHANNYGDSLGMVNYVPHKNNWAGEIKTIKMSELSNISNLTESNTLYSIIFDHALARSFQKDQNLSDQSRLDYTPFVKILQAPINKNIDVLLHLRLGDSYIYKISENTFLNTRIRKIVNSNEIKSTDLESQWLIEDISKIISHCNKNGLTYKIHCDGTQSARLHMSWTKDEEQTSLKEEIIASIDTFESELVKLTDNNENFIYGSTNINNAIIDILSSKLIIYTVGGFAIGINRFLNPNPVKMVHIKGYLNEIE